MVHGPGPFGGPWTPVHVLYTSGEVTSILCVSLGAARFGFFQTLLLQADLRNSLEGKVIDLFLVVVRKIS